MESISLASCGLGEKVEVQHIEDVQLSIQLYTMGCIPGEIIYIERRAPFGDPMLLRIEDSFISIRRKDAEQMFVKKLSA